MAKDNNKEPKSNGKSRRRGNHNSSGGWNRFRGTSSKQSKAILNLDPVEKPLKTTSIKIMDSMDNEVKERLPNFRDDNNQSILVEVCQKSISICKTYNLYNEDGDWKAVAQVQHHAMYGECKEA